MRENFSLENLLLINIKNMNSLELDYDLRFLVAYYLSINLLCLLLSAGKLIFLFPNVIIIITEKAVLDMSISCSIRRQN